MRSRSDSAASPRTRAWLRSATSTSSSGDGPSPATKSPKTASSCSPTGCAQAADARAAAFTSRACSSGRLGFLRDLRERRLATELRPEHALGLVHLLQPLDDVDGHADRARLVGERTGDGLADPPGRVGRELVAAAPVELLDGANEAERALLDQVEERQALVAVVLGNRDDEAQVRLDHALLGRPCRRARPASRARPPAPPSAGARRVGLAQEQLQSVGGWSRASAAPAGSGSGSPSSSSIPRRDSSSWWSMSTSRSIKLVRLDELAASSDTRTVPAPARPFRLLRVRPLPQGRARSQLSCSSSSQYQGD